MRIIYLHQYFNTPDMAGSTRSYEMARRMVMCGHEVHMITSRRDSGSLPGWQRTQESGIHVHWYPVPYSNHMGFRQRIRAFFSFAFAGALKATKLRGDVVFASSTPLTIAIPGVFAAKANRIPMVFEVRDLWPEMPIAIGALNSPMLRFAARRLERWAYRNSSAVVALSPGMKDGVIKGGCSSERVAVIPNGSDNVEFEYSAMAGASFRKARSWLGKDPLLVYAGTFGRINDVGYIIDVAQSLKAIGSNLKILLVGEGVEREAVRNKSKRLGVYRENVFFEDKLPKRAMPELLSAASMASNLVVDLPEARANSANKFFDTLAAGKPIFLNHGGWMHELVNEYGCGVSGWNVPVDSVARNLHEKLNDEKWRLEAGAMARSLATRCFDRDELARQLIEVLQAAVDREPYKASDIAPGIF